MRRFIVTSSANWNTVSFKVQTEVFGGAVASFTPQTEDRTGTLLQFFLAVVEAPVVQAMLLPDTHAAPQQSPNGLNPLVALLTTPAATIGGVYSRASGFVADETLDYPLNQVDLVNFVKFRVMTPGATLVSVTDQQWKFGVNRILIGSEIIYYQNATLLYGTTYKLTNLMRGMEGTAPSQHAQGEMIVLMNQYEQVITPHRGTTPLVGVQPMESVPINPGFLNRSVFFKATSLDQLGNEQPIANVQSVSKTYLGTGGLPLPISTLVAVSQLTRGPTYGEGDVQIAVTPTPNRNLQVSWQYSSVRIQEDSELESGIVPTKDSWFDHYRVQVYMAGAQVRIVDNQTTEGFTYTEAMSVADNGSWQSVVRLDISVIDKNGGQSPITSRTYKMT
jgi:hypothetical protein